MVKGKPFAAALFTSKTWAELGEPHLSLRDKCCESQAVFSPGVPMLPLHGYTQRSEVVELCTMGCALLSQSDVEQRARA